MVQVTSNPRELELKVTEEMQVTEAPGEIDPKAPELQTVRFEWPGLQVGSGPEMMVYKPNQRSRPGEVPQGMQPVPAFWLSPPRGAPWQYSGLTDNSLANGPAAQSAQPGWHGSKHILACGALVVFLLLIMRYAEKYWPVLRFRARRARSPPGVQVTCQLRSTEIIRNIDYADADFYQGRQNPPSYFDTAAQAAGDGIPPKGKVNVRAAPYVFASAKGKAPRLQLLDARRNHKLMERFGITASQLSAPRHMSFKVPSVNTGNDGQKQHIVIQINGDERESGRVIGLDVRGDKENKPVVADKDEVPVDLTVEALNLEEGKK